ncbi:MAG: hypothetical protein MUE73_22240, partial [Planctomycetes bacterium]|nr:hypothetical protein [Planctomycetota bacterium]
GRGGVAGAVEYYLVHRGRERLVSVDRAVRAGEWVSLDRLYLYPSDELRVELSGRDGIGRVAGEVRVRSAP